MDNRLKEAFDQVQAGRELETRTMTLVVQQMRRRQKGGYRHLALAVGCGLCLLCLLAGVRWFYFTPTAQISIDINPSLELGVNRLDKVVYVKSYNEDGQELAEELDLNFQSYTEALGQIVSSAVVEELLSEDGVMTIGVWGAVRNSHTGSWPACHPVRRARATPTATSSPRRRWRRPGKRASPAGNTGRSPLFRRWTPPSPRRRSRA